MAANTSLQRTRRQSLRSFLLAAELDIVRRRMIKAVAVGLAVDVGGSLVAGSYITSFGALAAVVSGGPEALLATSNHSLAPLSIRISEFVVGTAFSLLGGYVAGKLHVASPLRAGAGVGIATCIVALPFCLLPETAAQGAAWNALALAAAFVAATVGGALAHLTESPRAA